jgi:hypothetical protein
MSGLVAMTGDGILGLAGVVALVCGLLMSGRYFEPRMFDTHAWRQVVLSEVAPSLLAFVPCLAWWLWAY